MVYHVCVICNTPPPARRRIPSHPRPIPCVSRLLPPPSLSSLPTRRHSPGTPPSFPPDGFPPLFPLSPLHPNVPRLPPIHAHTLPPVPPHIGGVERGQGLPPPLLTKHAGNILENVSNADSALCLLKWISHWTCHGEAMHNSQSLFRWCH